MPVKKIVLSLFFVLATLTAMAQTKTVKGIVYEDETGEPMIGAAVTIAGTTKGVATNADGSFTLAGVKPSDNLKFEAMGKVAQIVKVGDMTNFIIKLSDDLNIVSLTEGSATVTGWNLLSRAASFSMYFLYSLMVVAPMT